MKHTTKSLDRLIRHLLVFCIGVLYSWGACAQFTEGVAIALTDCTGDRAVTGTGLSVTGTGLSTVGEGGIGAGGDCTGGLCERLPANQPLESVEVHLLNTGLFFAASGKVEFSLGPGWANFRVEIANLPRGDYVMLIDGVPQAVLAVTSSGDVNEGTLKLCSPSDTGYDLLTFDPRGTVVDIAQDGAVFLTSAPLPTSGHRYGGDDDDDDGDDDDGDDDDDEDDDDDGDRD